MLKFDINYLKEKVKEIPLSEREKTILDYRLGLTDNTTHTLEETGKLFGVTRERIRQIETKAIDKISQNFKIEELKNGLKL